MPLTLEQRFDLAAATLYDTREDVTTPLVTAALL